MEYWVKVPDGRASEAFEALLALLRRRCPKLQAARGCADVLEPFELGPELEPRAVEVAVALLEAAGFRGVVTAVAGGAEWPPAQGEA